MIILIYLALGVVLVGVRFPAQFARFAAREWPGLEWELGDTLAAVFLTFFAVVLWPLVLAVQLVMTVTRRLVKDGIHQRLVKIHGAEKSL